MQKNIRWLVIGFLVTAVVLPSVSFAQVQGGDFEQVLDSQPSVVGGGGGSTIQELQAQIAALLAQVQQLQTQLAGQGGTGQTSFCHDFNTDLGVGSAGNEVAALHTALQREGFVFNKSGLGDLGKSYFGEETASAVTGFQEKYRDEILTPVGLKFGTGYVGKSTRAKLNALYGCTVIITPKSSITVLAPNGGETLRQGQPFTIKWNENGDPAVYVGLNLLQNDNHVLGIGNVPNVGSYVWTVPTTFSGSGFKIKIFGNTVDTSDAPFSIVASGTTQPSITVLSPNGGEVWKFNEPNTITWKSAAVNDAYIYLWFLDGGTCKLADVPASTGSYSVTLKENQPCPNIPRNIVASQYRVLISTENMSVRDSSDAPFSIVSSGTTQPSITVLSPNGGEVWQIGSTQTISWQGGAGSPNGVAIYLAPASDLSKAVILAQPLATSQSYAYAVQDPAQFAAYSPLFRAGNTFKILMCAGQSITTPTCSYADSSDAPFSIVTAPLGSTKFSIGDRVVVVAPVNVRDLPSVSATLLGIQPIGMKGVVGGGPVAADGFIWWKINYDSSPDGWSVEPNLVKATFENLSPVIDGVSGPTALAVGQTGTWTVKAHDPENGVLSYGVDWGDQFAAASSKSETLEPSVSQTATFTHVYSVAGTYAPKFTVTDDKGLTAQTSISVVVGQVQQPSISVSSIPGRQINVAPGTSKVLLSEFTFTNNTSQSLAMGTINFLTSADVQSGKLSVSNAVFYANGTAITYTQSAVGSFSSIGLGVLPNYMLPTGATVVQLYADVNSDAGNGTYIAPFAIRALFGAGATTQPPLFQGNVPGYNILVTPAQTTTLQVSIDAATPSSNQLVMGSTGNPLATFRFTETTNIENLKITDLNIFQQVASTQTVKSAFGNLRLYRSIDLSTPVGTAGGAIRSILGTGYYYKFHFVNPVIVPQANSISLVLRGDVSSYSSSGSTDNTAHVFKIATSPDTDNDTPQETVVAFGGTSNAVVTNINLSGASGNSMTVLRSKLTVTATPLGVMSGRALTTVDDLATLNFSADPAGAIQLNRVALTFSGSFLGSPNFFANANSVILYDPATGTSYTKVATTQASITYDLAGYVISAGSSKSFNLRINSLQTAPPAQVGVSQTLAVTVNASTDVQWTDALDFAATSGLGLSASVVPIQVQAVAYAQGTGSGGGTTALLTASASHTPQNPKTSDTVKITGTASGGSGNSSVNIYIDGVYTRACGFSPCSYSSTFSAGTHTYYVRAVDNTNIGNQAVSATSNFVVSFPITIDTTPPVVSIGPPSPGATVSGVTPVYIGASDNVAIAGIQLFLDGASLGAERIAPPYSPVSWDTTQTANGTHTLSARARDTSGNQTTSAGVSVVVANYVQSSLLPSESITFPASGSTVSGIILINIDPPGTYQTSGPVSYNPGIEFLLNGTQKITVSRTIIQGGSLYNWDTATVPNGSYSLAAKLTDISGNQRIGPSVTVVVNNPPIPPSLSVSVGDRVQTRYDGVQVWLPNLISGELVQIGNQPAGISGTVVSAPDSRYGQMWKIDYDSGPDGWSLESDLMKVASTPLPDTTPPTASISAPLVGAAVSGSSVTVSANASDNIGVAGVQFLLDGMSLGAEDTSAPYTTSWNTTVALNGSHTLSARVRDAAGNQATSMSVAVTVNNQTPIPIVSPSDTTPPAITVFSNPLSPTTADTITINASVYDASGISRIDVYVDGLLKQSCTATVICSPQMTLPAGTHTYYAKATDNAGNSAASLAAAFSVIQNPFSGGGGGGVGPVIEDDIKLLYNETRPSLLQLANVLESIRGALEKISETLRSR